MPSDSDKIAAATLAAAMLRRLEPTGSLQEDAKARERAIDFADRLYRDLLVVVQRATLEAAIAAPPSLAPEDA
jgi:hypothetical protein